MEADDSKLIPIEDTSKVVPMEDVPLKKWESFLEDELTEQERKELLEWQTAQIEEGLRDARAGRVYSTEEVLDMLFGEEIGNL